MEGEEEEKVARVVLAFVMVVRIGPKEEGGELVLRSPLHIGWLSDKRSGQGGTHNEPIKVNFFVFANVPSFPPNSLLGLNLVCNDNKREKTTPGSSGTFMIPKDCGIDNACGWLQTTHCLPSHLE